MMWVILYLVVSVCVFIAMEVYSKIKNENKTYHNFTVCSLWYIFIISSSVEFIYKVILISHDKLILSLLIKLQEISHNEFVIGTVHL